MKLGNSKHESFARMVAAGAAPTQAYSDTYGVPSTKASGASARKLLRRNEVAERIREFLKESEYEATSAIAKTLRQLTRIAFADVRDLCGSDGQLLPRHLLPDDVAHALRSYVRRELPNGNVMWVIRFYDRVAAGKKLAAHLGTYDVARTLEREARFEQEDIEEMVCDESEESLAESYAILAGLR